MSDSIFENFLGSQTYKTLCDQAIHRLLQKSSVENMDIILEAGGILSFFKEYHANISVSEEELDFIRKHLIALMKDV